MKSEQCQLKIFESLHLPRLRRASRSALLNNNSIIRHRQPQQVYSSSLSPSSIIIDNNNACSLKKSYRNYTSYQPIAMLEKQRARSSISLRGKVITTTSRINNNNTIVNNLKHATFHLPLSKYSFNHDHHNEFKDHSQLITTFISLRREKSCDYKAYQYKAPRLYLINKLESPILNNAPNIHQWSSSSLSSFIMNDYDNDVDDFYSCHDDNDDNDDTVEYQDNNINNTMTKLHLKDIVKQSFIIISMLITLIYIFIRIFDKFNGLFHSQILK